MVATIEREKKEQCSLKMVMESAVVRIISEDEKTPLMTTTFWNYPRQSYGKRPKGNNKYPGLTPAFVIWNLVQRYTELGDLVVDPMAGSGTTLDVCEEEGRRVIGFDIVLTHPKFFPWANERNVFTAKLLLLQAIEDANGYLHSLAALVGGNRLCQLL